MDNYKIRINTIVLHLEMMKKNIGVNKLSDITGLSRSTISQIRGGKSCSLSTATSIANALDISFNRLTKN